MSKPKCFYPNGGPSLEEDIPCGTGSAVACCPLNWSCQSNGLCYLEDQNYYGRYTCTDKAWGNGCPNICTYDRTAAGNEAVLECSAGSYCCDTNRPELSGGVNCCDASSDRFSLDTNGESPEKSSPLDSTAPPPSESPSDDNDGSSSTSALPTPTSDESSYTSLSGTEDLEPTCNSDFGESPCGPICCASTQTCSNPGQCALYDDQPKTTSLEETQEYGNPEGVFTPAASSTTSDAEREDLMTEAEGSSTAPSVPSVTFGPTSNIASTSLGVDVLTPASHTITISVTPTSSPTSSPTSASVIPITQSTGFKAGVSVGSIVAACLLLIGLFFWRKNKSKNPEPITYPPAATEPPSVSPYPYDSTHPPVPNPYRQSFPENQPQTNSSAYLSPGIRPDHDRGQDHRPMQPTMQHAPALNPYAFPNTSQNLSLERSFGSPDQDRVMISSASPPPSYTTEDKWRGPRRRGQ